MAKGHENLIPVTKRTKEEAREIGKKGGKASGEARRKKRDMKASFETLFAMPASDKYIKAFKKQGFEIPDGLTYEQLLTLSMTAKAVSGDARMCSLIMDVMGEKHSDKMREKEIALKEKQANDTKNEALARLDSILEGLRDEAEADTETE